VLGRTGVKKSLLGGYLCYLFAKLDKLCLLITRDKDNQGGTGFDLFISAWLQLYMHLRGGKEMRINDFWKLKVVPCINYKISLLPEMPLAESPEEFPNTTADPLKNVLRFPHSNKAVDGCSAHMTGANSMVLFGYLYKFCRGDSADALGRKEVVSAYESLVAAVESLRAGISCSSFISCFISLL
jgi:hypothetical protein